MCDAHVPDVTLLSMKVEKDEYDMGEDTGMLETRRAAALM